MKLEDLFKEPSEEIEESSLEEYRKEGIFIYKNPEDFLQVMDQLQEYYLGAEKHE